MGHFQKGRILSMRVEKSGHLSVHFSVNGVEKRVKVHRIVAQAFIPNPNNYPAVNHKDENPGNNYVSLFPDGGYDAENSNLEWCTYEYNSNYGTRNYRISLAATNGKNSKKVAQLSKEGVLISEYPSTKEAERQTGFDSGFIRNCCLGRFETAYGYRWEYV
jgi:hypothetical protein